MRCPNCGFESEDNFCKICGIEIAEEAKPEFENAETEDISKPESYTETMPQKKKYSVKRILISALAVVLGVAVVSGASIGIYALSTRMEDKLYFHKINQKIYSDNGYSVVINNISKPEGKILKIESDSYYDTQGNYYDESSALEEFGSTNGLYKTTDTNYEIVIEYNIDFTFYNRTGEDGEIIVNSIVAQPEYSENSMNNGVYEFYPEIEIYNTDDKSYSSYINVPAWSERTVKGILTLSCYSSSLKYPFNEFDFKYDFEESKDNSYSISTLYGDVLSSTYGDLSLSKTYSCEIEDLSALNLPDETYIVLNLKTRVSDNEDRMMFFLNLPQNTSTADTAE